MPDLQVKNGKVAYLDDDGNTVYELPTADYTLDEVLSRGDSSNQSMVISDITALNRLLVPAGTTAERPSSPEAGMIRFNTSDYRLEVYNGHGWGPTTGISRMNYVNSTSSYMSLGGVGASFTASLHGDAQVGDFVFFTAWFDVGGAAGETMNITTNSSDWTKIGEASFETQYVWGNSWGTVLTQDIIDNGSWTVTRSDADASGNWAYAMSVYRPNSAIASWTARNFITFQSAVGYNVTLSNSGNDDTKFRLAVAHLSGRSSQAPVLSWSGANVYNAIGGSAVGAPDMGYITYAKDQPDASHTISTSDTGQQTIQAVYIEFAG